MKIFNALLSISLRSTINAHPVVATLCAHLLSMFEGLEPDVASGDSYANIGSSAMIGANSQEVQLQSFLKQLQALVMPPLEDSNPPQARHDDASTIMKTISNV